MADFLRRLRQRKLVQWALAYIAFAFALLQGVDIVAQRFAWPEQIERVLILVLVLGFFVTVVLAWYHGEREVRGINGTEIVILALLLAIGGGVLWWFARSAPSPRASLAVVSSDAPSADGFYSTVPAKSVAVLPLSNENGAGEDLYFSDGLSEDLINALSQFAGLKVISRNSSFQFRNSNLSSAAIGQALGVAHLLEGSVQRLDNQVRINAELVNAADGSTLWSQHYDRPYKDMFALQDEITKSVADALKARLLDGGGAAIQSDRPPGGNLDAWNAYTRGTAYADAFTQDDYREAIESFAQAIALDPHYARAYAAQAEAWTYLGANFLGVREQRDAYAKARVLIDHALQLDPDLAAAHTTHGLLLQWADLDWNGADGEYRRALQLAPNDSAAKFRLGNLQGVFGHPQQALDLMRQVISTDPRTRTTYYWYAWNLAALGRLAEAEQAIRVEFGLAPDAYGLHAGLAMILIQRGEAQAALAEARREPSERSRDVGLALALHAVGDAAAADAALRGLIDKSADVMTYQIAEVYALRGDPDNTFLWLDRAWQNRDAGIGRLLADPFILRYKDDPRFAAFCKKVGLPATTDAKAMQ